MDMLGKVRRMKMRDKLTISEISKPSCQLGVCTRAKKIGLIVSVA